MSVTVAAAAAVLVALGGCSLLEPGGLLSGESGDPEVLYVSQTSGSDGCHGRRPDCPLYSLADAVNKIAAGGTIKVEESDQVITAPINIRRSMTIEGGYDSSFAGADARTTYWGTRFVGAIITVAGDQGSTKVVLKNLVLRNAFSPTLNGAAVQAYEGTIADFENCTFQYNTSLQLAGAVDLSGEAVASFTNCTFRNNRSFNAPSGIHIYEATATFTGCEFDGNHVDGDADGAIVWLTTDASHSVSFQDCTFTNTQGTIAGIGGAGSGELVDLGGNIGMQPPIEDVTVVFTAWANGIAGATTVVSGPDIDGNETTTVLANGDGSIEVTAVVNTDTAEGTYTYEFTDYVDGVYTYNGTITAATSGNPPTTFDYDGELTMTGGDLESVAFDYTLDGSAFSGTITIDGEYEYDLSELGY